MRIDNSPWNIVSSLIVLMMKLIVMLPRPNLEKRRERKLNIYQLFPWDTFFPKKDQEKENT